MKGGFKHEFKRNSVAAVAGELTGGVVLGELLSLQPAIPAANTNTSNKLMVTMMPFSWQSPSIIFFAIRLSRPAFTNIGDSGRKGSFQLEKFL